MSKGTGIFVKVQKRTDDPKINLDIALKKFKKKQKEYGVMMEIKERQEFVKPSKKRNLIKQRAIARRKHMDIKMQKFELDFM